MKLTLFKDTHPPKVEKDLSGNVIAGDPKQHSQLMYAGHQDDIKSGIWESSAGVFTATMTDLVEFCHILEGSAVIKTSDGNSYAVSPGDAFVMEAGLETEWTVDTYIKKHFVICATTNLPSA